MGSQFNQISKFLSLVLRHKPEEIGLHLDAQGWANIEQLIAGAQQAQVPLDRATLFEVVASSDKQRFSISEDQQRIRANQGHSIPVDLNLKACQPPDTLYHGTATRFLEPILAQGLCKQARQHVHLSERQSTALAVGSRYGKAVLLRVDAAAMQAQGHLFYVSENQVWLVDAVPAEYLELVNSADDTH